MKPIRKLPKLPAIIRENLWPAVGLVTFGLGMWATLSLTTLAQEKENQRVLIAKSYSEEVRLATSEGLFPPIKPILPPGPAVPPERDAARLYAQIDLKSLPEIWKATDNMRIFSEKNKNIAREKEEEVDRILDLAKDRMEIAERASRMPFFSTHNPKFSVKVWWGDNLILLFVARAQRSHQTNPTQALHDLETVSRLLRHFYLFEEDNFHNTNVVSMRLIRKLSQEAYLKKQNEHLNLLENLIRTWPYYQENVLTDTDKYIKVLYKVTQDKKSFHFAYNSKNDPFLDINPYLRFLDKINYEIEDKIADPHWISVQIHTCRLIRKKQKEVRGKMSPRAQWKFYSAIEEGLDKHYSSLSPSRTTRITLRNLLRLTRWRQTMTLIALYKYKNTHGSFPQSLTELPQDTPITDPIMEKPFLWKQDTKNPKRGWLLYSPGLDEKDDGGVTLDVSSGVQDIVVEMGS